MLKHKKKEEFNKRLNLFFKQEWISSKSKELDELLFFCKTQKNKDLVFSLLQRFQYINNFKLNYIYEGISNYIVNDSGFEESKIQFLSMTVGDDADSSQKVLDNIKHYIFKSGWKNIVTINNFNKFIKPYNSGRTQILLIDEFIGSGQTLRGRIKLIKSQLKGQYDLKCCFVAGIKDVVEELNNDGIDVFCALELERGITNYFKDKELADAIESMLELESRLSQKINEKELIKYSFGFGKAEALYSMEGCQGNTPNSVFPIFWWANDLNENKRNTLLTRYEIGF